MSGWVQREAERQEEETEELENLRRVVLQQDAELKALREDVAYLHQVCRNVYEVWAGSEGIPEPITASEGYLLRLVIDMRDEAQAGLHMNSTALLTGEGE